MLENSNGGCRKGEGMISCPVHEEGSDPWAFCPLPKEQQWSLRGYLAPQRDQVILANRNRHNTGKV